MPVKLPFPRAMLLLSLSLAAAAPVSASAKAIVTTSTRIDDASVNRSNLPVHRESAEWRYVVRGYESEQTVVGPFLFQVGLGDSGARAVGSPSYVQASGGVDSAVARSDATGPGPFSVIASTFGLALFFFLRRSQ